MAKAIILPLPDGSSGGGAAAVNNAGVVVGAAYAVSKTIAWRVASDGFVDGPVELATGTNASAQDINEAGVAVGWGDDRATRWVLDWDNSLVLIGSDELFDPAIVPYSRAHAINDAGDICGEAGAEWAEVFLLQNGNFTPLSSLVDSRKAATCNDGASALNNATADKAGRRPAEAVLVQPICR